MDYQFEALGADRFQQFCQALLLKQFPQMLCLPVGQPDGGRDAIAFLPSSQKTAFIVYQVKFVKRPLAESEPHKWLINILRTEAPKIQTLIPKGASHYYLLTNVQGTAHLDAGSIDIVNDILREELNIPADCWWRDDLFRRLDGNPDIRWAYPELMTGVDLLHHLVEQGLSENKERRTSTIKAFIRDQYEIDKDVRFKQVELHNRLLDLFIDVPVGFRDVHRSTRNVAADYVRSYARVCGNSR